MSQNASNHRGRRRPDPDGGAPSDDSDPGRGSRREATAPRAGPQMLLPGVGFGPGRDGPYPREVRRG